MEREWSRELGRCGYISSGEILRQGSVWEKIVGLGSGVGGMLRKGVGRFDSRGTFYGAGIFEIVELVFDLLRLGLTLVSILLFIQMLQSELEAVLGTVWVQG